MWNICCFLNVYLFTIQRERKRDLFHLLIQSPDSQNGQNYAKPNPGAMILIMPHICMEEAQILGPSYAVLPKPLAEIWIRSAAHRTFITGDHMGFHRNHNPSPIRKNFYKHYMIYK